MPDLMEFFMLAEGRSHHFTLEPESNGRGRLLAWEEVRYTGPGSEESEEDVGYEVVAHGNIDELISHLPPELQSFEGEIQGAWDEAVQAGGEAVIVTGDGEREPVRVDIVLKTGKADGSDWSDLYDGDDGEFF